MALKNDSTILQTFGGTDYEKLNNNKIMNNDHSEEVAVIQEYLDGIWEHLAIWKKKDILEQAGFNLAISSKQEEYLDELHSEAIKSEDLEI